MSSVYCPLLVQLSRNCMYTLNLRPLSSLDHYLPCPQLCHCVVAVVGDLVPARDQEHGVHGPGPQQAQLHPGRRHPRPLPLLSLQGEVPQERPAQVPHVRQPPRAHRAQSETATDEDEEISGKEWNLNTSFGVNLVPTFLPI